MTRPTLAPALLIAALATGLPADPYVGFADLPAVFRAEGLDPELRTPLTVWAGPSPKAPAVAMLEPGSGGLTRFPVVGEEIDYEEASAKVFAIRETEDVFRPWVQVELASGARGWVAGEEAGRYRDLGRLYEESLADSSNTWDGRLHGLPGGPVEEGVRGTVPPNEGGGFAVDVVASTRLEGSLWLRVQVLREGPCEAGGEPEVVAEGWAPFFDAQGRANFVRYSRGC